MLERVPRIREQLTGIDAQQRYYAFRARLKENDIRVSEPRASELWKAAGRAIQDKQSVAAMAGPTQSPSADTQDGKAPGEFHEAEVDSE